MCHNVKNGKYCEGYVKHFFNKIEGWLRRRQFCGNISRYKPQNG